MLAAFTDFREEVVRRRTKFLLDKARDRAHVLVGLAIAVANIDEVIQLIRYAPTPGRGARAVDGARLAGGGHGAADRADRRSAPRLIADGTYPPVRGAGPRHPGAAPARLTGLGRDEIGDELKKLGEEIKDYLAILSRPRPHRRHHQERTDGDPGRVRRPAPHRDRRDAKARSRTRT